MFRIYILLITILFCFCNHPTPKKEDEELKRFTDQLYEDSIRFAEDMKQIQKEGTHLRWALQMHQLLRKQGYSKSKAFTEIDSGTIEIFGHLPPWYPNMKHNLDSIIQLTEKEFGNRLYRN